MLNKENKFDLMFFINEKRSELPAVASGSLCTQPARYHMRF